MIATIAHIHIVVELWFRPVVRVILQTLWPNKGELCAPTHRFKRSDIFWQKDPLSARA
jgi:hypothetical protein